MRRGLPATLAGMWQRRTCATAAAPPEYLVAHPHTRGTSLRLSRHRISSCVHATRAATRMFTAIGNVIATDQLHLIRHNIEMDVFDSHLQRRNQTGTQSTRPAQRARHLLHVSECHGTSTPSLCCAPWPTDASCRSRHHWSRAASGCRAECGKCASTAAPDCTRVRQKGTFIPHARRRVRENFGDQVDQLVGRQVFVASRAPQLIQTCTANDQCRVNLQPIGAERRVLEQLLEACTDVPISARGSQQRSVCIPSMSRSQGLLGRSGIMCATICASVALSTMHTRSHTQPRAIIVRHTLQLRTQSDAR